ncbi:MAG: hypothetical protein PHN54_01755 [Bacilli bacterium]|nr:hypothetical protein [Bacilli bacterium]
MNVIISNKFEALLGSLEIDVIKKITGEYEADEIISMFSNFFYQRMILDITAIKDYRDIKNIQKLSIALDMDKVILLLDDTPESTSSLYLSKLISMGIYNFTKNKEGMLYLLEHPNTYRDVAHIHQLDSLTNEVKERIEKSSIKILGIKNLTDQAGATTLIYMLKKQLMSNYKVVALEVDKRDFMFFNDKDMVSTTSEQFSKELIVLSDAYDIILVDLNSSTNEDACNDVLYLIEPSTIKLNKLMKKNKNIFEQMKNKKIVLNKSFLDSKDIMDFEVEANTKVYFSVPPLNDRAPSKILDNFLVKLGFLRQASLENDKEDSKVLGLFKF